LYLNLIKPQGIGQTWGVQYPQSSTCAVRGSSVVFPCLYDYPETQDSKSVQHQVETVMWCFKDEMCFTDSFVYHSGQGTIESEFIKRAEYLGDKHKNCTLNIKVIRTTDQGTYRFRFIVNHNKWTGVSGVALSVKGKELQVKVNSSGENNTVREGDRVTLICENRNCTSTQTELIWFKNGQPLSNTQTTANTLFFNPVSSESSGNYACALKNYPNSISQHIIMDVRFPDKLNIVLLASVLGTSILLILGSIVILIAVKR
uniref:Ig-like domain-containing protein n=1 Tax=Lepisosteus oculatus TaxID=7918 RepID=W5MCU4_LEPOC